MSLTRVFLLRCQISYLLTFYTFVFHEGPQSSNLCELKHCHHSVGENLPLVFLLLSPTNMKHQLALLTLSPFYFNYLNGLKTRARKTHKVSIILHLSILNCFSQQLTSIHYKYHCIWLHLLLEFIALLSSTLSTNTDLLCFSFPTHPT